MNANRTPAGTARCAALVAAVGLCFAAAATARAVELSAPTDGTDPAARAERLVPDLGAESFQQRRRAQEQLIELGPAALPAVTRAIKSDDAEVSARAERIAAEIRRREYRRRMQEAAGRIAWKQEKVPGPADAVVVGGGQVYWVDAAHNAYVADMETGALAWTCELRKLAGAGHADHPKRSPDKALAVAGDPVLAGDLLVIPTQPRALLALHARTGKLAWRRDGKGWGRVASDGDALFLGDTDGRLHALDRATGRTRWTTDVGKWLSGRPVADDDRLYAISMEGDVLAMQRPGGKLLWKYETQAHCASLTPAGEKLLVWDGGRLYALDRTTGRRLWQAKLGQPNMIARFRLGPAVGGGWRRDSRSRGYAATARPAIADGRAYVGCGDAMVAVDLWTGKEVWRSEPELPEQTEADQVQTVRRGGVLLVGGAGAVVVLRGGVGRVMVADLAGDQRRSPAIHDGVIYTVRGRWLVALDAGTGGTLWSLDVREGSSGAPVIADRRLVFGVGAGRVQRIGPNKAAKGAPPHDSGVWAMDLDTKASASAPATAPKPPADGRAEK